MTNYCLDCIPSKKWDSKRIIDKIMMKGQTVRPIIQALYPLIVSYENSSLLANNLEFLGDMHTSTISNIDK